MKALLVMFGICMFSMVAMADPVEVVLSTKITGVKDAKSLQNYVLKGNKARVYAKVQIHAKGYSNQGLRQWLERRLPGNVDGFFEREDKDSGLSVRYKPVAFKLRRQEIFCSGGGPNGSSRSWNSRTATRPEALSARARRRRYPGLSGR